MSFEFVNGECAESVVFAEENFILVVPVSAGLSLPSRGVRLNQKSITLAANETELGPVQPTRIDRVQAVGSFFEHIHLQSQLIAG